MSDLKDFDDPNGISRPYYASDTFKVDINDYSGPMSYKIDITPDYKFNEGHLIDEFREYVNQTYSSHYSKKEVSIIFKSAVMVTKLLAFQFRI